MYMKQGKTEVSTNPSKSPRPILEIVREFQEQHPDKFFVVDPQTEKWVRLTEVKASHE